MRVLPSELRWRARIGGVGKLLTYIDTLIGRLAGQSVEDMTNSAVSAQEAERDNELEPGAGAGDALNSYFYGTSAAGKVQAIAALEQVKLIIIASME